MPKIFERQDSKRKALTGGNMIIYNDSIESNIISKFQNKKDFKSLRIKRLMYLSDLTRSVNSPIKFITDRILQIPEFRDFDLLMVPETITIKNSFDLFNVPADHPSRKPTDTYFINSDRILRTQTTTMWFYYLNDSQIKTILEQQGHIGALCYGKVYRKDEIDSTHFPVFHQIDGLYIVKKENEKIVLKTLQNVLSSMIKSIFGSNIKFRFLDDSFPFTDPSTQVEIRYANEWLEVLGGGLVHKNVLKNLGLDPNIYNGWAFGFGLERLAMIKNNIPDIRVFWSSDPRIKKQFKNIDSQFQEVSKYPPVIRDISFVVNRKVSLNSFYEIVRHVAGDLVEEVKLTDEYKNNKKFGANKKSYTFRIIFRSHERTLLNAEISDIFDQIEKSTKDQLKAVIR